jgi:hypothetical protein
MFARAFGPYFAIVPTTVAIRASYMQTLFTEFKANRCGDGCSAPFS